MIFNVIIILAVAGIAYFHYAQGFFSAAISAVCAIIAATLAVSYHEPVVMGLLGGKMADYAVGLVLIGLFAAIYFLLRWLMDTVVPGQIRLPVIVDRIGGAAMGLIAGIFAVGVFAVAAQALPFGPTVGGYARYAVATRTEITIPPNPGARSQVQQTANVNDQLKSDQFAAEDRQSLMIPVDDWVLGLVQALSNGGSLAGDRTLRSVHPNYADELFGQRLGIQVGGTRVATNLPGKTPQVTVPDPGVFEVPNDLNKSILDAELPNLHERAITSIKPTEPGDKMQLVVRVKFSKDAADKDSNVRLSPGSVRLVAPGEGGSARNFYPVGTLEKGGLLYATKVDDYMIVNIQKEDRAADFVFLVNPAQVTSGTAKEKNLKVNEGVFIEVKRLARVDLSGKEVKVGVTYPSDIVVQVERKPSVAKAKAKPADASPTPEAVAAAPFVYSAVSVNKQLFSPINTGTPDKDVKDATIPSGTISLQSGQFTKLDINTTQSLQVLAQGSYAISELFEPTGKKLVQVQGTPQPEGGDPWAWSTLRNFTLVDAAGKTYAPAGGWAKVKKDNSDRMVASYNANAAPNDVSGGADDGRPIDVWIAFLIPSGTHLKALNYQGKPLTQMEQVVP